jgi:TPP-dependent pyruvate/acetoin dehydrogenase alpha subunit
LSDAFDYVRSSRKPYLLEINVSRLNGHSSSSGGNREVGEIDPIDVFEKKLFKNQWLGADEAQNFKDEAFKECREALDEASQESYPSPDTVMEHSFLGMFKGGLPSKEQI